VITDNTSTVSGKKTAGKTAAPVATAPAVSMTDDEELENSFPSYDGNQA
jgi:hypothetical protein